MIGPESARAPTPPAVGIFWRVENCLVIDRSTLDAAEEYGECLTHAAGHYERWEAWRRLGRSRLAALGFPEAISSTEYDEWPRGRVVYEAGAERFVVYADRRLRTPGIIACIASAFGIEPTSLVAKGDPHYR